MRVKGLLIDDVVGGPKWDSRIIRVLRCSLSSGTRALSTPAATLSVNRFLRAACWAVVSVLGSKVKLTLTSTGANLGEGGGVVMNQDSIPGIHLLTSLTIQRGKKGTGSAIMLLQAKEMCWKENILPMRS